MTEALAVYEDNVPAIADDSLLMVAQMAERRIDAVIKIKQMALKVTNAKDWTDQGGNPYLLVSGSEKIANLFNISWRIDEPICETEDDGHFTFTYTGTFTIPGRSIGVSGSRSSKDPFFKKYEYVKQGEGKSDKKVEKPISAIDRRDVKMAAMTNLLGNGITRLLGIRNLTYADLEAFAGIKQDQIGKVEYKNKNGNKPPVTEPQKKAPEGEQKVISGITEIKMQTKTKDGKDMKSPKYHVTAGDQIYSTFSESFAKVAKEVLNAGITAEIAFTIDKYGNNIVGITKIEPEIREPGAEG